MNERSFSSFPVSFDQFTSQASLYSSSGQGTEKAGVDELIISVTYHLADVDRPPAGNRYQLTGTWVVALEASS